MYKNVFTYEPHKYTLAFIDLNGTISGDLMKQIKYRQPKVIEKMHNFISSVELSIGDNFTIDDYVFIISRKHYRNKTNLILTEKALEDLTFNHMKTTLENFPELKPLLDKFNIEIYETSEWGVWEKRD